MPPLADAVRLVDGDETDRPRREHVEESIAAVADEALGRDVEQAIPAVAHAARHLALLFGRQRAVVAGRRHAVADKRVDLILHQRDQRRDDDRETVAGDRRRLEAERLAAAGRQHEQRIAAGQHGLHRFALQRTERVVAPGTCSRMRGDRTRADDFGFRIEDCRSLQIRLQIRIFIESEIRNPLDLKSEIDLVADVQAAIDHACRSCP